MSARMKKDFECFIDGYTLINIYMAKSFYGGQSQSFHLKDEDGNRLPLTILKKEDAGQFSHYSCAPDGALEVGKDYTLYDEHCQSTPASYAHIVKSREFARTFACPEEKFGCFYSPKQTEFRIWSPVAAWAEVVLDTREGRRVVSMSRKDKGIWQAQVKGNLLHVPYSYRLKVNGTIRETCDPYNPFTGVNATVSYVDSVDLLDPPEKTKMEPMGSQNDAIIYEASIRDMTSQKDTGVEHPKTFEGFCEENETTKERSTGLSYLKSLGITHVQLMPVLDFGSVDEQFPDLYYNWGYDPVHFRALEGSYSLSAQDPRSRMEEFAKLVHTLHENGIRVNLDLVFNHVWKKELFALENLVPDYYFLMDSFGNYSNGSFCGNDIDSRPEMSRRYLLDSANMLIDLYDVDGFRFDLMGILDINMMNDIAASAREKKKDFMIYGEGWDMPSYVPFDIRASQNNQKKMPLVGHFSDRFRDVVKGDNNLLERPGFAAGNTGLIHDAEQVMKASILENRYDEPFKAVNYVECHDNHTLWDKNRSVCFGKSREERMKRQVLTNAMVLLAQGVPFLHSGQEFCRTKQNLGNTYNCSDNYNMIDYHRRDEFLPVLEKTKELIALRRAHPSLRLSSADEIRSSVQTETIEDKVLVCRTSKDDDRLIMFFNPTEQSFSYNLNQDGTVLFDSENANAKTTGTVTIAPVSVTAVQL